ncbi:MAG: beta-galactosidase [Pirellulales bacterium]|nr:beta-galactosidase [Pirellulales bacterium]
MSNITYQDGRFYKDGQPFFLIAADYPYFRDRRDNWEDRLRKQKAAGINTITFYICWRHHLQWKDGRRWYDFTGQTKDNRDVVGYMRRIADLGLYMIVKPGPFIHSELNIGGLPDIVSPSFNPGIPAARRHHGRPAYWGYDASILPAAYDSQVDALCREWLQEAAEVIRPFAHPAGPVIALQPNDETLYCTSNDPPWHIGYEPSGVKYFQQLMTERYGDLENYNHLHGTRLDSLDFIDPPRLQVIADDSPTGQAVGPDSKEQMLRYVDWAEYQWRLRRDNYLRAKQYLNIDLPYLTNYAGITPPIQENVPDQKDHAHEAIPADYAPLYPEWWFAMNRIENDANECHYGMISWLGVAAYDRDVFDRYINTARRARGINMEENWGFGTLYDAKSRYPLVPFFQTLASVAGGATGYVIFTCVNTEHWEPSLDRITKLQCNSFPSHAPIDERGNLTPMYDTAGMLNRWFADHGDAFLQSDLEIDCAYLLYAPYAAVSSWTPDERFWRLKDHDIPRCGRQGFEEFSQSLQQAGYAFGMFELDAASDQQMQHPRSLAIHSAFFMDHAAQDRLARYIESGGKLFISGELPIVDLEWRPCERLKQAVEKSARAGNVVYDRDNLFANGKFAERLAASGIRSNVGYSLDMRTFVYKRADAHDYFIFFFNFDLAGEHEKQIEFYGQRLSLRVGSKTSGALRVQDGKLVAWLVKGLNEVEGITAKVRIQYQDQVVEQIGDFSSSG